jgi:hypothetical protein
MQLTRRKIQTLALLVPLILTLFISGCASSSGGAGGVRTFKETEMDVSLPMMRYRNAVAAGTLTQFEQQWVDKNYGRYQAAWREALHAANNDPDAPASDNVLQLAAEVIAAVHAVAY